VNGTYSGLVASVLMYGSMVVSRPTTETRGTLKPRARPARMLTICSSKWRGTSRSRARNARYASAVARPWRGVNEVQKKVSLLNGAS
jgi:hypothetical protein